MLAPIRFFEVPKTFVFENVPGELAQQIKEPLPEGWFARSAWESHNRLLALDAEIRYVEQLGYVLLESDYIREFNQLKWKCNFISTLVAVESLQEHVTDLAKLESLISKEGFRKFLEEKMGQFEADMDAVRKDKAENNTG